MSSYCSNFTYLNQNSSSDKNLIVVSFEPDNGFKETFLSMDVISDEYYDGSKLITYNSRYNTTATIEIQLIKENGEDITLADFRDYARWLTGARKDSWLNLYHDNEFQYAFLCRCVDLQQFKLDARTVGLKATFSSVTPWAFSEEQHFNCSFGQKAGINEDGILHIVEKNAYPMSVDKNGTLYSGIANKINSFSFFWK